MVKENRNSIKIEDEEDDFSDGDMELTNRDEDQGPSGIQPHLTHVKETKGKTDSGN